MNLRLATTLPLGIQTKTIDWELKSVTDQGTELTNLELTSKLLEILGKDFESVEFIADRLGHDRRYSVNSSKIEKLGYQASQEFERNLIATINSYINPLAALQQSGRTS